MRLLFQSPSYSTVIIAILIAVPSLLSALIAALVARTYYRTGIDTRINAGLKEELALAERRATRLSGEVTEANKQIGELRAEVEKKDAEFDVLVTDYTQLSQLFAKKSVLFELITGVYERMGNVAEAEGIQGLLKSLKPIRLRGEDDSLHRTDAPDKDPGKPRP